MSEQVRGAARPGAARFAIAFLALFCVLTFAFEMSRESAVGRWLIGGLVLAPAAALINWVIPHEDVAARDSTLESPRVRLRVVRGCEGIETILLIASAVLAFPASWRQRIKATLVGISLAWALSVARLAFLYWTLRYSPQVFDVTHGLIAPLAPIALLSLYFFWWSARARPAS